ncbi:GtrA family protein [Clostridium gasigenes]|uniref:GtrA family protein n=2 Tax=Clostridium gasigenes TaxID=94869 RepID=A0A7X0VPN5_9CLOT|nr:GtrA family protein [Clostridium gasigenes]
MNTMNLYEKYEEKILYVIFGVGTTIVNIITYVGLTQIIGLLSVTANIIAWIISILFAYITNKIWVFKSNDYNVEHLKKEVITFVSARAASGGLDIFIMYIFVQILSMNDIVIKISSNILVVIINYFFSKLYVFKAKE